MGKECTLGTVSLPALIRCRGALAALAIVGCNGASPSPIDRGTVELRPSDRAIGETASADGPRGERPALDGVPPAPDGPPTSCGAIVSFETGKQPSKILHVATSGSDGAGDGSAGKPFATIVKAAAGAQPGTAIRIHAGSYPGGTYLSGLAGNASAPIWLGGAPGEARPLISGGGEGLHLSKVRYLVVHDLEVTGVSSNGINADDGGERTNPDATRFLVFRGLAIHGIGAGGNQDCLKLSGVNDFQVLDSSFSQCGGGQAGSGIDHVGCHDGLIARCSFKDLSGNAVQAKGGSENLEIRWNLIVDGGERALNLGGSTGFDFFRPPLSGSATNAEARKLRAVANVIVGGTAALAYVGCVDCLVANNTIVTPHNWILRILQETVTGGGYAFAPASNGTFVNNLVVFDRSDLSTTLNVGPNTQPSSFVFKHNLWFARDDPSQSTPSLPVAESAAVIGLDPKLANPAAGNYTIPLASPAAKKGTPVPGVTGDRAGRCYASPPSIGAHEAS
ncbi:MAG: hypothetical protein ACOY3Y_08605 [Acidobacteriota bacterium]